jgi:hypothetical protein
MPDERELVVRAVDLMAVERAELATSGPPFLVVHRFWQRGTICTPGEAIMEIHLLHRGLRIPLPLSLRLMLLFDYLARHRHGAQSATQVAAGLSADLFSQRHGAHARAASSLRRGISRTAVKQQIMRLRAGLRSAFREAGLSIDPGRILVSEKTTVNEMRYRLKASVIWEHVEF